MRDEQYPLYLSMERMVTHRLDTYNLTVELDRWQEEYPADSDPASPELKKAVSDLRERLRSYFDDLDSTMDDIQKKIDGIEKKVRG